MTTARTTASAIAELQAHMDLSFTKMGSRIGVDRMTVFGYIRKSIHPSLHVLGKLAQIADEVGRQDLEEVFLEPFAAVLGKSAGHIPNIASEQEAA